MYQLKQICLFHIKSIFTICIFFKSSWDLFVLLPATQNFPFLLRKNSIFFPLSSQDFFVLLPVLIHYLTNLS